MDLQHSESTEVERRKEKRSQATSLVIGGLVAVALLAFVVQNADEVSLHWLFFTFTWPLWLMVVVVIAVTLVLAKAVGYTLRKRRTKAAKADAKR